MVINALVLACSNSRLREIVGTDALRSVLEVRYHNFTAVGVLDLQPVWQLLADQPGFQLEAAAPPLCRFKTWEKQLGLTIKLPDALEAMSPGDRYKYAEACTVPARELQALFALRESGPVEQPAAKRASTQGPRAATNPPPRAATSQPRAKTATNPPRAATAAQPRAKTATVPPARASSAEEMEALLGDPKTNEERRGPEVSPRRKALAMAAAALGLLGIIYAGIVVYQSSLGEPSWQDMSPAAVSSELPLRRTERLGDQVRGVLASEDWLAEPEDVRRDQLTAALRALQPTGVTVLFLQDSGGRVRAVAQLYANATKIRIQFP